MAPKRASQAPPPASVRRSARLASRSPSVEPETVSKRTGVKTPRRKAWASQERADPRGEGAFTPLLTARKRADLLEGSLLNRSSPLPAVTPAKPMSAELRRELKMREIRQTYTVSEGAAPAPSLLLSPPGDADESPKGEGAVGGPPANPSPPPQTSAEREQPRAGWRMLSTITGYLTSPFTRKRPAGEPVEPPPSPKRSRVGENEPSVVQGHESPVESGEQTPRTPRPALTPRSPRGTLMPSTKNPRVPTSLSTITEYTEPSILSAFSESVLESTPSRAPMPQNTPLVRRSAQLRAARAKALRTPINGFAARKVTPRPKETNADTRLAKLERLHTLQRELAELEQDKDVQDMQSHRVKRVKIDNLVQIPHNRPGDPSGCFRVPEEDSDDEMEVYDDVEERSNLFEEINKGAEDVTMREGHKTTTPNKDVEMMFSFPAIPPAVPAATTNDHQSSAAFRAESARLFEAGLAEFASNYGEDGRLLHDSEARRLFQAGVAKFVSDYYGKPSFDTEAKRLIQVSMEACGMDYVMAA